MARGSTKAGSFDPPLSSMADSGSSSSIALTTGLVCAADGSDDDAEEAGCDLAGDSRIRWGSRG